MYETQEIEVSKVPYIHRDLLTSDILAICAWIIKYSYLRFIDLSF